MQAFAVGLVQELEARSLIFNQHDAGPVKCCARAAAGRIRRVQSGADFNDDAGVQGKVSAEPPGKGALLGVTCPPDPTPFPSGDRWKTPWTKPKPCRESSFGLYGEWESECQNGYPGSDRSRADAPPSGPIRRGDGHYR